MADYSTPSKLVGERITLTFNFINKLLWSETLSSAVCTVEVASGDDAQPEDVLYLTATVSADGLSVTQQVYQGVPGVIYRVICTGIGSLTHTYTKRTHLAVLPDDEAAPPLDFVGQIETVEMSSGA